MPGAGYAPRSFARVEPFTRSPHPPLLRGFPYPGPGYRNPLILRPPAAPSRTPGSTPQPPPTPASSTLPALPHGPRLWIRHRPPSRPSYGHAPIRLRLPFLPYLRGLLPATPPDQALHVPVPAHPDSPAASSRPSAAYSAIKCLSYKHRYDPLPHHSTNFLEEKFAYLKI